MSDWQCAEIYVKQVTTNITLLEGGTIPIKILRWFSKPCHIVVDNKQQSSADCPTYTVACWVSFFPLSMPSLHKWLFLHTSMFFNTLNAIVFSLISYEFGALRGF